jgi:hypothetical protein
MHVHRDMSMHVCVNRYVSHFGCLCWYVGVVDVVTTRPCRGPERYACLAYYLLMYLFSHVSSE